MVQRWPQMVNEQLIAGLRDEVIARQKPLCSGLRQHRRQELRRGVARKQLVTVHRFAVVYASSMMAGTTPER